MSNTSDFVIENGILKEYVGPGGNVVIPEGVTEICWSAFRNAKQTIREVTIPESVKTIDNSVFSGSESLEKVHILGNGLERLGRSCFKNCVNLTEVRLPDSVRKMPETVYGGDNDTFTGCTALIRTEGQCELAGDVLLKYICEPGAETIVIPAGVRFITGSFLGVKGWSAGAERKNAEGVKKVVIPEGVVYIGNGAFSDLPNLTEVEFPASLRTIGESAFAFLNGLKKVDLSHTAVDYLDDSIFNCCFALEEVLLPQSLRYMGNSVFHLCEKLARISLPDGLETIGTESSYADGTFSCTGLVEVVIPEGVERIHSRAFAGSKELKKVHLPGTIRKIDEEAFLGCKNLCEINIPESLTDIGDDAFRNCAGLKRPEMNAALAAGADEAFWNRLGFGDENGCVVKDGVLVKYVGSAQKVVISEGVEVIPERVLRVNSTLAGSPDSYQLPDSLKKIEEQDFGGFTGTKMNLPAGYLQTQEKLPAKYTVTLLEGAWKKHAQLKDYAAMWLFQSGKDLVQLCSKEIKKKPENTVLCFAEILSAGCKAAHVVKAAEFILENKKTVSEEAVRSILSIAQSKKAKKAVELLQPLAGNVVLPEAAKTQKTTKSSKAAAEKQDEYAAFRKEFDEHLLSKTFRKYSGTNALLENVKLAKGGNAPAFLVKCAIVPYLEQFQGRPKHISGYNTDYVPVYIVEKADEAGALLDRESLQAALKTLYDAGGSAWLLALGRYGSNAQIASVISDMRKWESWNTYGSGGRSDIIIARGGLMLSDTREAMLHMDKKGLLDIYARLRGTDADAIRDSVLAEFGLDEAGRKEYDLGGKKIIASLMPDLTLSLFDEVTRKTVKSIPKKGADPALAEQAATDFAEMKKNIKKVVKSRNETLFGEFLSGRTRNANGWVASYTKNPLLRQVAQLLVWNQKKDTFTLTAQGAVDCHGNAYEIKKDVPVGVAHPMEMGEGEALAWQKYFASRGLKQPFEQVWEPAFNAADIRSDRYAGCMIPFYRFRGQGKHGITVEDVDFHNEIYINFACCSATVARIDWRRHDIDMNDKFEVQEFSFRTYNRCVNHIVAYLDRVTVFERIKKDDAGIAALLPQFTLAQITEFIKVAAENNCTNVMAVLLDYKNRNFGDFDPMEEFSLDL